MKKLEIIVTVDGIDYRATRETSGQVHIDRGTAGKWEYAGHGVWSGMITSCAAILGEAAYMAIDAAILAEDQKPELRSLADCCPPGYTLLQFMATIQIQKDGRTVAEVAKPYDKQSWEWWTQYLQEAIAGKP